MNYSQQAQKPFGPRLQDDSSWRSAPRLPDNSALKPAVIIPAYNEEKTIVKVIESIGQVLDTDIIVIDDNSSDNTAAQARQTGAEVLSLPLRLGTWTSTQTGFRYALQQGYQLAVTFDADGQHMAQSIPDILTPVVAGDADVSIGSFPERGSRSRKLAWKLFQRLAGINLEDLTSGLKAYNRRSMELLLSAQAYLFDYQDLGALLFLLQNGFRIHEVPVTMLKREHGHSRIFSNWWKVSRYMLFTSILCASKHKYGRKLLHAGCKHSGQ
jgi:hypothetical protein